MSSTTAMLTISHDRSTSLMTNAAMRSPTPRPARNASSLDIVVILGQGGSCSDGLILMVPTLRGTHQRHDDGAPGPLRGQPPDAVDRVRGDQATWTPPRPPWWRTSYRVFRTS